MRENLDGRMKLLRQAGVGVHKNQAEPITAEEDSLWRKGLLGDDSLDTLRNTMVWMCGLYFALRGGKELRSLRAGSQYGVR